MVNDAPPPTNKFWVYELVPIPKNLDKSLALRLGAAILARRKTLGLTQAGLAEKIEVSTETIARFERATYLPSLMTLGALAEALNCELSDLLRSPIPGRKSGSTLEEKLVSCLSGLHTLDTEHIYSLVQRESTFLRRRARLRK